MKDVVIVGAGLSGLAAAWKLRGTDALVLEAGGRVGGRIRSERRGPYVLNWGGHVFAGAGSSTDELLRDAGVGPLEVPGSLAGLAMNGKLLLKGPVPSFPFRIPMPLRSRMALVRAGARVSVDVLRYARTVRRRPGESPAERQQRIYDFENDRSFAEYLGPLPAEAEALFHPTVTRSAGEPDELSAGAGIGYFSLVWNIGQGLARSIVGGPSTLPESIAAALDDRILLDAQVEEVVEKKDHVLVRYRGGGVEHEVAARSAVLSTPAPITRRIAVDLPEDTRAALRSIRYGPYVSCAFLTGETTPQVWDRSYGIAAPNRSFSVALNMGNIVHGTESTRRPGGSMMTFSPARLGAELLELDDEEILDIHLHDLDQILPGFAGLVEEAQVQRWHLGAPYCFPGRAALQNVLTRRSGRVQLAGDYLGTLYTETAISSGFTAAQEVARVLTADRPRGTGDHDHRPPGDDHRPPGHAPFASGPQNPPSAA